MPLRARSSAFTRLWSRLTVLCVYRTRSYIPPFLTKSLLFQAAHEDVIPLNEPVTTASGEAVDQITVGAGMSLIIPIRAINRSDAFWGPDAKEFKPERWLENEAGLTPQSKEIPGFHHFFTFNDGPRICLGKLFAVAEFKVRLSAYCCDQKRIFF